MADESLIGLLRSIDRRLALLTGPQERAVRAALMEGVLNTEPRQRMFDALVSPKGTSDLAIVGGVTQRAALNFVNQLLELRLVCSVGTGRDVVVARDEDGIIQWYLQQATKG